MKFDRDHRKKIEIAKERILKEYPGVIAIYLFGSFGTEYEDANSDIDIAFLPKEPTDTVKVWNLAQSIASTVDQDVELIDLHKASTVFCYHILSSSHCVFCQDDISRAIFENAAVGMYLRFQETRKEILNDYSKGQQSHG